MSSKVSANQMEYHPLQPLPHPSSPSEASDSLPSASVSSSRSDLLSPLPIAPSNSTSQADRPSAALFPLPRFASRNPSAWPINRLSLLFFILLSLAVAGLSISDILRQTLAKVRPAAIQDTAITLGSCLLVIVSAVGISLSRFLTVKKALGSLPQVYIPITSVDFQNGKNAIYKLIDLEYQRICLINLLNQDAADIVADKPLSHLMSASDEADNGLLIQAWLGGKTERTGSGRLGLLGWGEPGSQFEGRRFSDEAIRTLEKLESALENYLPKQPSLIIPTRDSLIDLTPLKDIQAILDPQHPTQPTPILLTSAEKLLFQKYFSILTRAMVPYPPPAPPESQLSGVPSGSHSTLAQCNDVVDEADYQFCCKGLMVLLRKIKLCQSDGYENPFGYGSRWHPTFQGIRFKDAILETAVILERKVETKFGHLVSPGTKRSVAAQKSTLHQQCIEKSEGLVNPSYFKRVFLTQVFPSIQTFTTTLPHSFPGPASSVPREESESVVDHTGEKEVKGYLAMHQSILVKYCELVEGIMEATLVGNEGERTQEDYEFALRCLGVLVKLL